MVTLISLISGRTEKEPYEPFEAGFLSDEIVYEGRYCDALRTLADDPPLRSEFGTAGRRRVEERYTRTALAENFTAAVRGIT